MVEHALIELLKCLATSDAKTRRSVIFALSKVREQPEGGLVPSGAGTFWFAVSQGICWLCLLLLELLLHLLLLLLPLFLLPLLCGTMAAAEAPAEAVASKASKCREKQQTKKPQPHLGLIRL